MGRYKSITVDVDVDVDLSDFDTCDLIEELVYRIKNGKEHVDTKDLVNLLTKTDDGFVIDSVVDQMKLDHISNIFKTYSFSEITQKLPLK